MPVKYTALLHRLETVTHCGPDPPLIVQYSVDNKLVCVI